MLDAEYIDILTRELAEPLGLDCEFGFSSEDIARYTNRYLLVFDKEPRDNFEAHLDSCPVCLLRIIFLIKIRNFLIVNMGKDDVSHGLYLKLFNEIVDKIARLTPVPYPEGWKEDRNNCCGDITKIWLDGGNKICLKTSRISERSQITVVRIGSLVIGILETVGRKIFSPNSPCVTIRYPDPVTATLIRILPPPQSPWN